MKAIILTEEQKNSLIGKEYAKDIFFNPVQDADGNWVISEQQIDFCDNTDFGFIKNLQLINFKPKPENTVDDIKNINKKI